MDPANGETGPQPARPALRLWLIVRGFAPTIGGIEYLFGWPDMLSLEPRRSALRP